MRRFGSFLSAGAVLAVLSPALAIAQDHAAMSSDNSGVYAIAAAIVLGLTAAAGTFAQGKAVSSALDSIGRNPGASGNLFVPMLLGLALIESLVVIAFVLAYMLLGKF